MMDERERDQGADSLRQDASKREVPSNGVVVIDGKTATSVNFQRVGEPDAPKYDVSFRMASKVIHKEQGLTPDQLEDAIGRENADRMKNSAEAKGSLKGEALAFNAGNSPDELVARVRQNQEQQASLLRDEALERASRQRARDQLALDRLGQANAIINASAREHDGSPAIASAPTVASFTAKSPAGAPAELEASGSVAVESDQLALRIRESLAKRYLEGDHTYHYRGGKGSDDVAFSYTNSKIVTQANSGDVVRDMVALSVAQGWTEIRVTGSDSFRREAWLEASLYGLKIDGYKPRDVDLARLDELKADEAKRTAAASETTGNAILRGDLVKARAVNDIAETGRAGRSEGISEEDRKSARSGDTALVQELRHIMKERGDSDTAITMAAAIAAERLDRHHKAIVGTVKEHGSAPYQHIPDEKQSYFVTLDTKAGEKTIWGVDLERAVAEATVKPGQLVALEPLGRKAVEVEEIVRDESGNRIGTQNVSTHRNHWQVVHLEQLDKRERAELTAIAARQGTVAVLPERHREEAHHVRVRDVQRVDLER